MANINHFRNKYRFNWRRAYAEAYGIYVKSWTWLTCGRRFEAEIDPFRLLYINPADVRFRRTKELKQQFSYGLEIPEVKPGNWDRLTRPFEDNDMYVGFKKHFLEGVDWEMTEFYQRRVQIIENGGERWGCHTEEEFLKRCSELDRLFEFIANKGYLTQAELRSQYHELPSNRPIHWYRPPCLLEVTVDIDRDGEFIFHEGRNRMCIAKLLEINQIPVRVKGRHEDWQTRREHFVQGDRTGVDQSHPDLTYLE